MERNIKKGDPVYYVHQGRISTYEYMGKHKNPRLVKIKRKMWRWNSDGERVFDRIVPDSRAARRCFFTYEEAQVEVVKYCAELMRKVGLSETADLLMYGLEKGA